jgi:hypothetical protein
MNICAFPEFGCDLSHALEEKTRKSHVGPASVFSLRPGSLRYPRRVNSSSIHVIAAYVAGQPIVVIARMTTCSISSRVAPD